MTRDTQVHIARFDSHDRTVLTAEVTIRETSETWSLRCDQQTQKAIDVMNVGLLDHVLYTNLPGKGKAAPLIADSVIARTEREAVLGLLDRLVRRAAEATVTAKRAAEHFEAIWEQSRETIGR